MSQVKKRILVSGASFAGLSTAHWMHHLGHEVTIVETAPGIRWGGTAVNLEGSTIDVVRRMGLLEPILADRLSLERWDFKDEHDVTVGSMQQRKPGEPPPEDEIEIERDVLLGLLFDLVKHDVELVFGDGVTALHERGEKIEAVFRSGAARTFDLVLGCDGLHSAVRRLWFGSESQYVHFLKQYFSITIVEKSLVPPGTAQMFNVPGKAIMLNASKDKTDIVLCFVSENEVGYDYRDQAQQRAMVYAQFEGVGWRAAELLDEVRRSQSFYFDKLCQVRMPSWSRGRVALVGDAGYCPSPAAGKGGSLAIDGAAALADAFHKHPDDFTRAFAEYETSLRPFVEQVQEDAVRFGLESLVPRTEDAIRARNAMGSEAFAGR